MANTVHANKNDSSLPLGEALEPASAEVSLGSPQGSRTILTYLFALDISWLEIEKVPNDCVSWELFGHRF